MASLEHSLEHPLLTFFHVLIYFFQVGEWAHSTFSSEEDSQWECGSCIKKTPMSVNAGREIKPGHPELPRKAWRLKADFLFLTFFLIDCSFTWKACRSFPGWFASLISPTGAGAVGLGSMRKSLCIVRSLQWRCKGGKSVLTYDSSSRRLFFVFWFLLVVYPLSVLLTVLSYLTESFWPIYCILHLCLPY